MPYKDPNKQKEYQRNWVKSRRLKFMRNKVCADCGEGTNLEIHHNVPDTKVSHKIFSWSEKRFKSEIKKCSILCNECHKYRTFLQRSILSDSESLELVDLRHTEGLGFKKLAKHFGIGDHNILRKYYHSYCKYHNITPIQKVNNGGGGEHL